MTAAIPLVGRGDDTVGNPRRAQITLARLSRPFRTFSVVFPLAPLCRLAALARCRIFSVSCFPCCRFRHARANTWKGGGWCGGKPSSSSNFSIRAFRAYPFVESREAAPGRAIRGNGISVNSTLPPLISEYIEQRIQLKRKPRRINFILHLWPFRYMYCFCALILARFICSALSYVVSPFMDLAQHKALELSVQHLAICHRFCQQSFYLSCTRAS